MGENINNKAVSTNNHNPTINSWINSKSDMMNAKSEQSIFHTAHRLREELKRENQRGVLRIK